MKMKYRNIVFDMGNVLIGFDPVRVVRRYTSDPDMIREIRNVLFSSGEWIMLDAGLMSEKEAMERILPRFRTEEQREIAIKSFEHWHEYNMCPGEGMAELIRDLKARGQHVYILSNASMRLPECYRNVIPEWQLFEGVMFSAEEKCLKPQALIYERFFEKFGLKPEECFFIDDLRMNIEGAAACGMDGYVFDGNVEKLRRILEL